MATWRKGIDQAEVVQRLQAARSGKSGTSFSGFEHMELVAVLNGMVDLNATIPDIERSKIVTQATFEAAKQPEITSDVFLRSVRKKEAAFLAQPLKSYRLYSGISLASSVSIPSVRFRGAGIRFGVVPSKKGEAARSLLIEDARRSVAGTLPIWYSPLSVSVRGRSENEAGTRALDALDTLRAIWNLALNRGTNWRWSSGRRRAVNAVVLFPIHSLHNVDGSIASKSWWYDPGYTEEATALSDKSKIRDMLTYGAKVRVLLGRLPYVEVLTAALLRYGRALDSPDLQDAFLRLWSVLEVLTDSGLSPYTVTARRAAFLYRERDYSYQVLTTLADYRNRFVHAGTSSEEIEGLLFLLKRYVESLLLFHLVNRFAFSSLAEASTLLDLPTDKAALAKRIRLLTRAKAFVDPSKRA